MKKLNAKLLKKTTNILFTYSQADRPKNAFMVTDTGADNTTTVAGTSSTTHIFGF